MISFCGLFHASFKRIGRAPHIIREPALYHRSCFCLSIERSSPLHNNKEPLKSWKLQLRQSPKEPLKARRVSRASLFNELHWARNTMAFAKPSASSPLCSLFVGLRLFHVVGEHLDNPRARPDTEPFLYPSNDERNSKLQRKV